MNDKTPKQKLLDYFSSSDIPHSPPQIFRT